MRSRSLVITWLIVFVVLFSSCRRNQYKVNVSSVKLDLSIDRLEKGLFTISPDSLDYAIPGLIKKYGKSLQAFSYAINAGEINDTAFNNTLKSFCTDKLNNEVYTTVVSEYGNIDFLQSGLKDAFCHYLYYFPSGQVPAIFTTITGFNRSIITLSDEPVLGISLDLYLGRECKYYSQLEIYNYLKTRMNSYNIISDCMYAWGVRNWEFESMSYNTDIVFSRIIHEGKLKYFERCMLPELQDTLLFGYSHDQMNFCLNNEAQMWNYLIEKDLLYSSDQMIIRKLTGEGPFTSFFSTESPGKAGVWIGFRIIEAYMRNNPSVTLEQLMNDIDYQNILEKARYNPQ